MVFSVGWSEATIIILLALLLFGPEKMTDFARTLGRLYAEYKNAKRRFELEVLYGKEVIDKDLKEIRELKKLTEIDGMKIVDTAQVFPPDSDFSSGNSNSDLAEVKTEYSGKSEHSESEHSEHSKDSNETTKTETKIESESSKEVKDKDEANKNNKNVEKNERKDSEDGGEKDPVVRNANTNS